MSGLIRHFALSAILVAGLVPAAPSIASAQGVELDLGGSKPRLRLVDPEQEELRRGRQREEERERRRRPRDDDSSDFRCNADRALDKAARLGIRRARVTSLGRRFIEVAGRRYGERVEITFARDRRCSVVD